MLWRNLIFTAVCLAAAGLLARNLLQEHPSPQPAHFPAQACQTPEFLSVVQAVDSEFEQRWATAQLNPAPPAPTLTLARRLSLALTGTIPSLQEIRTLEQQPDQDRVQWWLSHLFEDQRYSDYLAERFARTYVGIEGGPFLVYRRHRLVEWIAGEIHLNRPYDQLTRSLIDSKGIWTSHPEVNFVTVTIDQNDKKGPDEAKLAARVTRAFLGVRLDCVQCHDDKFSDQWKQSHFHELAAFFGPAEMSLTGLREGGDPYQFRYHRKNEEEVIPPVVPFAPELMPAGGSLRERLAQWVTHPGNKAFARTTVNRIWALLFNRPLHEPIDEIPLEGPLPPGMEILARDFAENNFDIQRLIRIIASTRAFSIDSRARPGQEPLTTIHYDRFAAFPLTRLRPEQVAGSLLQAASIRTIDAEAHFIRRLARAGEQGKFVKRYGDIGEDEFASRGGTIPQRLLLMNGELTHERTKENIVMNASTRILAVSPGEHQAVETAYLSTLTRRPTETESRHFTQRLEGAEKKQRSHEMQDLQWSLLNSTEFSWSH